ncbi:hypothetical protein [Streptomyces triticisoli]|uniref:hypothetical protein n=1 Tax=Streptomyces triticisoli TaxID=2182797 RepID=UPI000DD61FA3|nr:hypothetical protein [Streptomyces triticisoli]
MTAADAHGTGEMPGEAAPENGNRGHDKTLRDADRMDKWSIAWTLTALLMWGVFAMLMLASDSPDASGSAGGRGCQGPLIAAFQERGAACEGGMRQWPVLLGVLVLALIPTIVAAATTVYARLLSRLATALGETGGGTRSDGEKDHGTA